ncbi:hypothetical protein C5167_005805 [Papaver somniferum]|uniref:Histone-lysine N-methyltransferase n=1 Tax=Papaver somniferum TaxID=3469 RepID=A0A4Y7JF04_PAPSO|nr:histone-lysine N-methyltransferase, H3 lysine-9 specific SUVH1-like [Papaver somniferum]RZC58501.1 hypothetical protein C5167_005805 [Papaver somniferum]
METGLGSDPPTFDKNRVLDVKPLRCISPISSFPPFGSQVSHPAPPQPPPNPTGFSQFSQFYQPFFNPSIPQYPVHTPAKPDLPKKNPKTPSSTTNEQGNSTNSSIPIIDSTGASNGGKQRSTSITRPTKRVKISEEVRLSSQEGDSVSVGNVLMKFDALRRRLAQVEGEINKRPDLTAGSIMMAKGLRTNMRKRVGVVNGIEVGDIFYFRIELCLVGLHAQSMAGIDYMVLKFDQGEEPVALSVVSSGGYEDDVGDGNVLIYSGQGGKDEGDQKLERGNLALEKSLHRASEVRVIRGVKDVANPTGKVYMYDGLYKIQKSWTEKTKTGAGVFKFKMVRMPGQPEAFTIWKSIQSWREDINSRPGLILQDITAGAEKVPVPLVNEIDIGDGRPAPFLYHTGLKYLKPVNPLIGCQCQGGKCLPSSNCSCILANGGDPPYANGILAIQKSLIHECGPSCSCYPNCKNQVSQNGPKVRLEVFMTKNKGWGLCSWDPIRAGTFICEYAGEVIDKDDRGGAHVDDDYIFNATHLGDYSNEWNYVPELIGEEKPVDLNEAFKPALPMMISAKKMGNVARFMNHGCSPNVFWQLVLRGQNKDSFPHIMFYAFKHIPPMTELTYDYVESGRMKQCFCGSANCRSFFG